MVLDTYLVHCVMLELELDEDDDGDIANEVIDETDEK